MAFGLGAFAGGFAKRTMENRDEEKKFRRQLMLQGIDDYKSQLQGYKKNKVKRQANIEVANSVVTTTAGNYSKADIMSAGNAVGWKDVKSVQDFLRDNYKVQSQGAPRADQFSATDSAFGPEPQAPTIQIPTTEERNPLLDVFTPRSLPTQKEVSNLIGGQPSSPLPGKPEIATPSFVGGPTGGISPNLKAPVPLAELNALRSRAEEGIFPAVRDDQGTILGNLQVNRINSGMRTLQVAIANDLMEQGVDRDSAYLQSEEALYDISQSSPIKRAFDISLGNLRGGDVSAEQEALVSVEDPEFNDIARFLDQYKDNSSIFEAGIRAFRNIATPEALDAAIAQADDAWFEETTQRLEDTAASQEEFDTGLARAIRSLPQVRRQGVVARLRAAQDAALGATVATEPTQEEEDVARAMELLGPDANVSPPSIQQLDSSKQETDLGTRLGTYARERMSLFAQATDPKTLRGAVKAVFGELAEGVAQTVNTFSPEGQVVTTALFEAANKRGESIPDVTKNSVLAALRTSPEKLSTREYISSNEGDISNERYTDSQGHQTIGVGFNLDAPDAKKKLARVVGPTAADDIAAGRREISDREAEELLTNSLAEAEAGARSVVRDYSSLPEGIQKVLTDMSYNLGTEGLKQFKKMIKAIDDNNWETALDELLDSEYAFQTGARAIQNAELIAREIGVSDTGGLTQEQLELRRKAFSVRSGTRGF